jgi:hypothetical protein
VTFYLRAPSLSGANEMEDDQGEVTQVGEVAEAILKAIADEPFSSVRKLARHICLSRTTVHQHLTHSLSFAARHLRSVPHRLSDDQKAMRVDLSAELLR